MKKKGLTFVVMNPQGESVTKEMSWHNGGDVEIGFYARCLHRAAKNIIASLDLTPNPKTAWDACPVVLLYRQSVELHLKALVGEGCGFLRTPTDPLTLAKTHSLRWLAQIVCQIVRAVRLENEFRCESVATLPEFTALVNDLEELDPVAVVMQPGNRRPDSWVPDQLLPPNVLRLAAKLDSLIGLLESTTDALAALNETESIPDWGDFKPTTIQKMLDNPIHLFHTVGVMAKGDNLGEFELLILAALMMLGDNAYGMTVHEQVEKLAAGIRAVSLGSCYTTLDRLEQKGFVRSWFSDPTPERGGRSKRFFEITGSGELALKNSVKLAGNVLAGLREIGGLA